MTITAKVILDSISPDGVRLTTLQLRYPLFIHAECKTHRVLKIGTQEVEFLQEMSLMDDCNLSRNASSSRAIPVDRMIQDVLDDPAIPIHWGKNQPGMSAEEELDELERDQAIRAWLSARNEAVSHARWLRNVGLHKQISNRVLAPFLHINTLVTATEWENFFNLRLHPSAQPEIQLLAQHMYGAMVQSNPTYLHHDEWHLPFSRDDEDMPLHIKKKLSCARAARLSYLTHEDKVPSVEADLALYDRLITSKPAHASPAEHQACPDVATKSGWESPHLHGNFRGWQQFRKVLGL